MHDTHPMQQSILRDRNYKSSARTALATIRHCYRKRIAALRSAYDEHIINEEQLNAARKILLAEAAFILYTHPGDDPKEILNKLIVTAEHLDQQNRSFSIEIYLSGIST